ncbi:MAG TPA: hypothetical protein VFI03_08490 [Solirubrobacterales bacterium]|nr:hypothetical protein [Solirubrobacterales bacterium]
MELMQASPTEKRLDDLDRKVEHGFERVDERFAHVELRLDRIELELRAHGKEFVALRNDMKAGFERMEERFDERSDAMYRLLVLVSATLLGTVITACAALVATQL